MRLKMTMVRDTENFWVFEAPIKNDEIGVLYLSKIGASSYYHRGAQLEIIQSTRPNDAKVRAATEQQVLRKENEDLKEEIRFLKAKMHNIANLVKAER